MTETESFQLPLFAGVDVGGTNVKVGIVDDLGAIVADTKFPTQPNESPDVAVKQAKQELEELLSSQGFSWNDVAAVGVGTPGPMDIKQGMILTPTNLPGWHQYPIRDRLSHEVIKPVTFANDAGAAAFGEYWVGGGQAFDNMVLLTLGTGVGGGIIVNDFSIDGEHSHGAELGHVTIETGPEARMCGCGVAGHLEAYASATALVDRTKERLRLSDGAQSKLRTMANDTSPLSALMVSNAAEEGDELAYQMVMETAGYLARGIAQLSHTIDPAAFILGGAMNFGGNHAKLGQAFLQEIVSETRKVVFPVLGERLVVRFAEVGSEAGFVGAAGLARSEYNRTAVVGK
ncbi:MAG: ROK family protein [Planctomycetota bacterium]